MMLVMGGVGGILVIILIGLYYIGLEYFFRLCFKLAGLKTSFVIYNM